MNFVNKIVSIENSSSTFDLYNQRDIATSFSFSRENGEVQGCEIKAPGVFILNPSLGWPENSRLEIWISCMATNVSVAFSNVDFMSASSIQFLPKELTIGEFYIVLLKKIKNRWRLISFCGGFEL